MEGLSRKELEISSWLEFYDKYFFSSKDVDRFTKNKTQRYNIIKSLLKKKRIVKLNRNTYYLITTKAKSGSWTEHPFIIADEASNSMDYYIGGWAAANYWKLTGQIPMQIDIYTTKRQGVFNVLNTRLAFHRTTKNNLEKGILQQIEGHSFRILDKGYTKKWMKSKR